MRYLFITLILLSFWNCSNDNNNENSNKKKKQDYTLSIEDTIISFNAEIYPDKYESHFINNKTMIITMQSNKSIELHEDDLKAIMELLVGSKRYSGENIIAELSFPNLFIYSKTEKKSISITWEAFYIIADSMLSFNDPSYKPSYLLKESNDTLKEIKH